jgi:cysteine desulfurase
MSGANAIGLDGARVYLDWNASAPLRPEAREAMLAALDVVGNASSVHAEGRRARAIVETAREAVAALVGAKPSDVVFTSGATEANNWIMSAGWDVIALGDIEHDSVRAPARACGAEIIGLTVGEHGDVGFSAIESIGKRDGALLALQLANNETGVIQAVGEAAALARRFGVGVHSDAVQAPGRTPVDFRSLGVDTMSLSAHKMGGPKGIGALVIRDGLELPARLLGGGQERRRRAGTENVAAIAGFGAAAKAAARDLTDVEAVRALRDRLECEVLSLSPEAIVVGRGMPRLANTSCIALPGRPAETLVINLDLAGIAVSAGAACSSGKVGASTVLTAMGLPEEVARAAIRVSIGPATREEDITRFCAAWRTMAGERHEKKLVA